MMTDHDRQRETGGHAWRDGGFDVAFHALATIAYRVAYRVLGDRAAAEDVTQETLARALVHWARIAPYAEAWTARTASNLAIGEWRKRTRSPRLPGRTEATADVLPLDRMELVAHLARLPRRQREVVVLRYLADLPEATVAAALGCSTGTVKQHASRGLGALRIGLAPTLEGDR